VKVGLFINTQFQPGQSVAAHLPDLVAQTRAARDAGFKSLWFPHHFLTGRVRAIVRDVEWSGNEIMKYLIIEYRSGGKAP